MGEYKNFLKRRLQTVLITPRKMAILGQEVKTWGSLPPYSFQMIAAYWSP